MMVAELSAGGGEMRYNEPLSRHTSWRVGGPARHFYCPSDSTDLARFMAQLPPGEPLLWLGMGSNLLVRDGGFRGTVVTTRECLHGLRVEEETLLRAEAGVACPRVARSANQAALCGLEFMAGIPGTLGGALAMNAGAFGAETWQRVERVETIDRHGRVRERLPEDFHVGYRRVTGPEGEWFLAARFRLEQGDPVRGQERIRRLLEQRAAAQPLGQPSCGSVFRNPEGDHAARLIEAAGLKGVCIGGACVSARHANFIINTGNASAADIEELIERVRAEVEAASGVHLETEVRIVGERR